MGSARSGIFCIEGEWSAKLTDSSSVSPMLELLRRADGVPYIHRTASTTKELVGYLDRWSQKQYDRYRIGYLAFHGDAGGLWVGKRFVTLDRLAGEVGRTLKGKTLFFGSCATLDQPWKRLEAFRSAIGARAIIGYTEDVDWIESTAFELTVLEELASSKRVDKAMVRLRKDHRAWSKRLGLRVVWKGGHLKG